MRILSKIRAINNNTDIIKKWFKTHHTITILYDTNETFVCVSRCLKSNRLVVTKIVDKHAKDLETEVANFMHIDRTEQQPFSCLLAKIQPQTYLEAKGLECVDMEYVGPTLWDIINEMDSINDLTMKFRCTFALYVTFQIIVAVVQLNQNSYCHRDIKPENICIDYGVLPSESYRKPCIQNREIKPFLIKMIDIQSCKRVDPGTDRHTVHGTLGFTKLNLNKNQATYNPLHNDLYSIALTLINIANGNAKMRDNDRINAQLSRNINHRAYLEGLYPDQRGFVSIVCSLINPKTVQPESVLFDQIFYEGAAQFYVEECERRARASNQNRNDIILLAVQQMLLRRHK
eukprot:800246_1